MDCVCRQLEERERQLRDDMERTKEELEVQKKELDSKHLLLTQKDTAFAGGCTCLSALPFGMQHPYHNVHVAGEGRLLVTVSAVHDVLVDNLTEHDKLCCGGGLVP